MWRIVVLSAAVLILICGELLSLVGCCGVAGFSSPSNVSKRIQHVVIILQENRTADNFSRSGQCRYRTVWLPQRSILYSLTSVGATKRVSPPAGTSISPRIVEQFRSVSRSRCGARTVWQTSPSYLDGGAFVDQAYRVLGLLAVAHMVLAINVVPHYTLLALGRVRFVSIVNIGSSILSLAAAAWLVSLPGLEGAAIGRRLVWRRDCPELGRC